jgi:hypothetical protein
MSPTPDGRMVHTYAMQGDTAKAKAAYQDFLTLWKDADPDIPYGQNSRRARCPTLEPHFKHRFMINQAR